MPEAGPRLRVVIVEDHPMFRDALARSLSLDEGIEIAGLCGTPEGALARIRQVDVDVVITDLAWRGDPSGGIKLIHQMRAIAPGIKVIVCSAYDDEQRIRQAIQAGVDGYLLKDEVDTADVVRAVKTVQANGSAYSATIVKVMARLLREPSEDAVAIHPLETLTTRERETLPLLVDGLSNAEIGRRLGIEEKTVKTHVSHILQKLDLSSRYQLADYLRRQERARPTPAGRTSKA